MKIHRPALLVLLTATLTGLGVPGSFSQARTFSESKNARAKSIPSKTAQGKTAAQKAAPQKKAVVGSVAAANPRTKSSAVKAAPAKPSAKTKANSARKTSGRSSSTKRTRKQPGQKAPTNERISEIQTALAKDGSFQGLPNGKWDDDTSAAMRRFQSSHGLNASGKLDAPTLQRLGLGSETAGVAAPTPPPGATSRLTSSNNVPSGSGDPAHRQ